MKRRLTYAAIAITLSTWAILAVFLVIGSGLRDTDFECHSNVRLSYDTKDEQISSNIFVNLMPNSGYYTISGSIVSNEHPYTVHRDGYFTIKPGKHNDEVNITRETVLPGDNVDNRIWYKYFSPRPLDVPFYRSIKRLAGNLYFVTLPSTPLYVCVRANG